MTSNERTAFGSSPNAARTKTLSASRLGPKPAASKPVLRLRRRPFPNRSFRFLQRHKLLQTFIDLGSQP